MNKKVETPMLDKMIEIQEESQLCGEFLDFIKNKFYMFDKNVAREQSFYIGSGDYIDSEKILAEFFNINLEEANIERERLLKSLK